MFPSIVRYLEVMLNAIKALLDLFHRIASQRLDKCLYGVFIHCEPRYKTTSHLGSHVAVLLNQ